MAVVENRFVCDLSKPVQAQALKGNVFSLDNLGSRISVLIYNNGQPATISGSVTANCILPDGSTVNVNGGLTTENGGSKAYVDVPQSCLLIPGILKIAIKCTSSSVITTLAAIVANVYMTKTDNVITPSQQIITDWNAEISAAIATQNASIANQDTKINDLKSALTYEYDISDSKEASGSASYKDTFLEVFMPAGFYRCELECSSIGSVFLIQLQSARNNGSTYTVKTIMTRAQAINPGVVEFTITAEESNNIHYVNIVNYTASAYTVSCTITNLQNEKLANADVLGEVVNELSAESDELNSTLLNSEYNADVNGIDEVSDYKLKIPFEVGALNYTTGEEIAGDGTARRSNFIAYPNHDITIDDTAIAFLYASDFSFIDRINTGATEHYLLRKQTGVAYIRFMIINVPSGETRTRVITMNRVTDALFSVPIGTYENLLDVNHYRTIKGKMFLSDGTITGNSDYLISWYIPVVAGKTYYITGGGSVNAYNVFYDENLDIVSTSWQKTLTAPAGSAFMRCSIQKMTSAQAMVKTTDDPAYVPYGQEIKSDYYYYIPDMASLISSADLANIRVSGYKSTRPGYIDSIYAKFNGTGTADIYIVAGNTVMYKFSTSVVSGVNVFKNGVDFTYNDLLPTNTKIGISSANRNTYYGADGHSSCWASNTSSASVGTVLNLTAGASYDIAVGFVLKMPADEAEATDNANKYDHANKTVILEKDKYEYYLDEDEISLKFSGNTGKLKIYHTGSPTVACGSMIVVDIDNWNLIFAKAISKATMANYETQSTQQIELAYVSGHAYAIKYKHTTSGCVVTITDTITRESVSYTNTAQNCGEYQGEIGYSADTGITVTDFVATTINPFNAKTLVIGDSYSAGYTMWRQKDKRWWSLYADQINDKVFMSAMGGESTNGGLNWMTYLADLCHPEYVIIELGVNDGNLDMYKTNINAMIDYIKNYLHAKPILVVIPKTDGASSSIYASIDSFVKSSGEKYIDMLTPLTVNGDGVTQNLDLFFADKVHPNVAGHQAIFEQMKIDVPELFVNY